MAHCEPANPCLALSFFLYLYFFLNRNAFQVIHNGGASRRQVCALPGRRLRYGVSSSRASLPKHPPGVDLKIPIFLSSTRQQLRIEDFQHACLEIQCETKCQFKKKEIRFTQL